MAILAFYDSEKYNGSDDLSFKSGTHVLVRYSETSDYFVSNYVELDF